MKKFKKLVVLSLVLLLFVAAGCSNQSNAGGEGSGEAKKEKIKIGMSFQEMNNPYFISMKEAFEEAAAQIGAETVIADAQHDVTKQINDIDDMIQKKLISY